MDEADETTQLVVEAEKFIGQPITSSDQYIQTYTFRGLIKDMVAKITADKTPGIESAKDHLALLRKELSDKIDPLNLRYRVLGSLLGDWNTEQERIKKRKELEEEARQREAAQKEKDELAALAKQMGNKDLAKEIKAAPLEVAPVVVTKDVPKLEGLSYSEHWHYQVVDLMALVKAVAAGKVPIQAIADPSKPFRSGYLNTQATRLKSTLQYPGVKVWMTKDPSQS